MIDEKIRLENIRKWLKSHPAISVNAICSAVGYDTSNFNKAIKGNRPIPPIWLDKFEKELKKYGYRW